MRRRAAPKVVSRVLSATVAGFAFGARGFIWRLFAFVTAAWLAIWIGAAIFLVLAAGAGALHAGTRLESLGIVLSFILVAAIVLMGFPELWIVILAPPILLFWILRFFDFVFSPIDQAASAGDQQDISRTRHRRS
jgi:hypothetical protein